jgi:hypothetical protein
VLFTIVVVSLEEARGLFGAGLDCSESMLVGKPSHEARSDIVSDHDVFDKAGAMRGAGACCEREDANLQNIVFESARTQHSV